MYEKASEVLPSNTSVKWFKICMVNLCTPESTLAEKVLKEVTPWKRVFQQFINLKKVTLHYFSFYHSGIFDLIQSVTLGKTALKRFCRQCFLKCVPVLKMGHDTYFIEIFLALLRVFFQVRIDKELNSQCLLQFFGFLDLGRARLDLLSFAADMCGSHMGSQWVLSEGDNLVCQHLLLNH